MRARILLYHKIKFITNFRIEMAGHDKNTIYCFFNRDIADAKNLILNVIFYVDFFNYHFNFSRERFAAKFIV